jgi:photosystem II stability/assembly factor-like uncharacterized protein
LYQILTNISLFKKMFNPLNPNCAMKKMYIFSFLFFWLAAQLFAQNVPNGEFENWDINEDGGFEPVSWQTLNTDSWTDVFQAQGHQGQYAAQLSAIWDDGLQMYAGAMLFLDDNFTISERFTALSFYLQGTAVETDYLSVNLGLFKNGIMIGNAITQINQAYGAWTKVSLAIDYLNDEIPDSAFIGIQIYPLMNAHDGTMYTIDELNLNMGSGSSNPELLLANTNVQGTAFELGFSKPMADPSGDHNQFSGKRNGNNIGFTSASLKPGDNYIIVLTLADPVLANDLLKVSYTAGTVTSGAGDPLESFTDHAVINEVGGTQAGWQVIQSGVTEDLYSVHFATNSNGFIGGAMSRCLKSSNEGLNWSIVPVPSGADFRAVWATSSNDVYLGAWDSVYATHNGGQAWAPAYTNSFLLGVMGLQFTSSSNGFAFMTYSSMTKTTDAGNSWSVPTGPGIIQDFYDGYMLDDITGYGVGDCGLIAKTTDGGATWNQYDWNNWLEWSCIQIWGVHFTSALNGYATADSGVVFRTTDGGTYWSRSVIGGTEDKLNDVFFVNPAIGYIAGNNGRLFKTTNGGDTWIPEATLTSNDLHSVFFISENLGWVVGNNGTILRFGQASNLVQDPSLLTPGNVSIFPNPLSLETSVQIKMDEELDVEIDILDISGREMKTEFNGKLTRGTNLLEMNLGELRNGIYICRISSIAGQVCKPLLISK